MYITEYYDIQRVRQMQRGKVIANRRSPQQALHISSTRSSVHSGEIFAYRCEGILVAYSINQNGALCTPEFSINVVDRMNGYLCNQPFMFIHGTQCLSLKDLS